METSGAWRRVIQERVALYGHRNWIAVVDAAYPAQSSAGVETLAVAAELMEVVEEVFSAIGELGHLRPIVMVDRELKYVDEGDAPGVAGYRERLDALTRPYDRRDLPHEEIIASLDRAGATFLVLILKTETRIPYTSVFLNLDCAYWTADAERRLRATMSAAPAETGSGSRL